MNFQIKPDTRYRMPVSFGPAPGPRQHPEGRMWRPEETGTMRGDWGKIALRVDAAKLEPLLPPGFTLRGEPILSISCAYFSDVYWLAGRGYGIVSLDFPVTYRGKTETIEGSFCPLVCEGSPDGGLTGREELGFPKLFANFSDYLVDEAAGTVACDISWMNHTFCNFELHDLVEVENPARNLPGSNGGPQMYFKYIPNTSPFGRGGADCAYVTTAAPLPGADTGVSQNISFDGFEFRKWTAKGSVSWHRATFQQLPLMAHVVNQLADLAVGELVDAEFVRFSGPGIAISMNAMRGVEPA